MANVTGQTRGKRRGGAADLRWVEGGQRGRERTVSSRNTLVYVKNIAQKGAEFDLKKGGGGGHIWGEWGGGVGGLDDARAAVAHVICCDYIGRASGKSIRYSFDASSNVLNSQKLQVVSCPTEESSGRCSPAFLHKRRTCGAARPQTEGARSC